MPHDAGEATTERRSRPWTVRLVGLLLLLQAIAYVGLTFVLLLPFDWLATTEQQDYVMPQQQIEALSLGFLLIPTAILGVLSAIGFLLLRRGGWLLGMAMQGATLLGCLTFYFDTRPPAIFPVMVFCILMALYLNSYDVRAAFHGGEAGHG